MKPFSVKSKESSLLSQTPTTTPAKRSGILPTAEGKEHTVQQITKRSRPKLEQKSDSQQSYDGIITSHLMTIEEIFGNKLAGKKETNTIVPLTQKNTQQKNRSQSGTKEAPTTKAPILTFAKPSLAPKESTPPPITDFTLLFQRIFPLATSSSSHQRMTIFFSEALPAMEALLEDPEMTYEFFTEQLQKTLLELNTFGNPTVIDPKFFLLSEVKKLCYAHNKSSFYTYAVQSLAKPDLTPTAQSALPPIFHDAKANLASTKFEALIDSIATHGIQLIEQAQGSDVGFAKTKRVAHSVPYSLIARKESDGIVHLYASTTELGSGGKKRVMRLVALGNSTATTPPQALASPLVIKPISDYVKALHLQKSGRQFTAEVQSSKRLRAAGAEHVLEMHAVSYNGKTRLFSEACELGDLNTFLAMPRTLETRMKIAAQQAETLSIAHNKAWICILDVKTANIFMQRNKLTKSTNSKLGDLGTCKRIIKESKPNKIGRVSTYPPPEMRIDTEIAVSPAIDMWAFGIMLYQLKYNKQESSIALLSWQYQGTKEYETTLSEIKTMCHQKQDAIDKLIIQLLSDNPANRPSAQQALKIIENFRESIQT